MGGVATAGQNPRVVQNRRGGANRGQPTFVHRVTSNYLLHARIRAELRHTGAAREEHAVEKFTFHRFQSGVGVNRDAATTGNVHRLERRGRDLGTGPPQQINGRERLNLFEAVCQDCEYGGHAMEYG